MSVLKSCSQSGRRSSKQHIPPPDLQNVKHHWLWTCLQVNFSHQNVLKVMAAKTILDTCVSVFLFWLARRSLARNTKKTMPVRSYVKREKKKIGIWNTIQIMRFLYYGPLFGFNFPWLYILLNLTLSDADASFIPFPGEKKFLTFCLQFRVFWVGWFNQVR